MGISVLLSPAAGWRRRMSPSTLWKHFTWSEISGAVGDLGTFLPLTTALAANTAVDGKPQLDFGAALLFSGIYNVIVSFFFDIPIPIQPMKAIVAASLVVNSSDHTASPITNAQIRLSGMFVGVFVLCLLASRSLSWLQEKEIVPRPIIRGIQLGLGIKLMQTAMTKSSYGFVRVKINTEMVMPTVGGEESALHDASELSQATLAISHTSKPLWFGLDSIITFILCILFCIGVSARQQYNADSHKTRESEADTGERGATTGATVAVTAAERRNRLIFIPSGLILFLFGLVIVGIKHPDVWKKLSFGISLSSLSPVLHVTSGDLLNAFWNLALPQLPLTMLNSIFALCLLADDLFPSHKRQKRSTAIETHYNKDFVIESKDESEESETLLALQEWYPSRQPGTSPSSRTAPPDSFPAPKVLSIDRVSLSIALGNIAFCLFGGVPSCHGSGGLSAQYAFGARTHVANFILGASKICLALSFGASFLEILKIGIFPGSVLGAQLWFSGFQLCLASLGGVKKELTVPQININSLADDEAVVHHPRMAGGNRSSQFLQDSSHYLYILLLLVTTTTTLSFSSGLGALAGGLLAIIWHLGHYLAGATRLVN